MSTLGNPSICPDCRATLVPPSTCPDCGLVLQGPEAAQLWQHLTAADFLIDRLRLGARPVREAPVAPTFPVPPLPTAPPAHSSAARRLPAFSVPVVLLGLGAICLLVAAIVFVAVTWSSLGLGGRTAIMAGVTTVVIAVAVLLTHRGLCAGAETLWLVAHVMIAIDVVAAAVADLAVIGDLDPRHVAGSLGVTLLVSSIGASAWATGTAVPRLAGLVGVTGAAALLVTAAEAWSAEHSALATALSIPLLGAGAALIALVGPKALRPHAYAVGIVGGLSWLVTITHGLDRATTVTASHWWQDLVGWPFLVAAAVAAGPALARALPESVRYVASAASIASVAAFAAGGTASGQTKVLVACAIAGALAVLAGWGPRTWAVPAALMSTAAALVAIPVTLVRPFGVVSGLPTTAPARGAGLDLRFPATTWDLDPWTAPIIAAVALVTTFSLIRHLRADVQPHARSAWLAIAPVMVGLGSAIWFLESQPRLLPAVIAWSALVALVGAVAVARRDAAPGLIGCLALAAYLIGLGLRFAVPSHLLVALFASAVGAVGAAVALRSRTDRLDGLLVPVTAGASAFLVLFAATHWPYLAHGTGNAAGVTLAISASVIGLAAAKLARTPSTRITLEVVTLVCGLASTAFVADAAMTAIVLTIVGSAVAVISVLHRDRDDVAWVATGLLAIALLIRIDDNASVPELVTLPAALLLMAAGIDRLLRDPAVSSRRALSSGLALGLVPSLLGALEDPVSVRGAAIGTAGLAVLALGITQRWAAPFIAGALVVAVVALRHLGPVAAALPRWISLGSIGVALLLVGITWEARRRNAQAAERYLAALR